ncbi:hypothetical protein ACQ4M3_38830 [Leptolyngbya sp. AN03gr2]|uniref:hypothetical protein n=1 Tax=unclassified Leptolyngbya TaxID=2650499 RepID=UPI003D311286
MNQEHTEQLFERFDRLYRGRHRPQTENLMCYGFCCGDGWFDLIWQLSEQIEAYCQQHPQAQDLMATQVKEKFGELRFYTQPKIWDVEYLIDAARMRSLQTCELTGAPGNLCKLQSEVDFCCYQTLSAQKATELGFVPIPRSIHPRLPPRSEPNP